MKKQDVQIGKQYVAKISGKLTTIRLTNVSPYGGWDAVNIATGRVVRIRTAAKLRKPAGVLMADTNRALNIAIQVAFADGEKAAAVSSFGADKLAMPASKEIGILGAGGALASLNSILRLTTGVGIADVVEAVVNDTQGQLMHEVSRNIRDMEK